MHKEIYINNRYSTPDKLNLGLRLRQIVDEENLKIRKENDRLRVLNRKLEQNMSDVVKKLEMFDKSSNGVDMNNIAYSPTIKSMLKYSNDFKYKQILREYEVKLSELQQK